MNRRFPIRKRIISAEYAPSGNEPPLPEFVEQKYTIVIYGDKDPGNRPVSVRIEDRSITPPLTVLKHYSKHDYMVKGIGNVYVEMEKELKFKRSGIWVRK